VKDIAEGENRKKLFSKLTLVKINSKLYRKYSQNMVFSFSSCNSKILGNKELEFRMKNNW
jgi:hypothetical protein